MVTKCNANNGIPDHFLTVVDQINTNACSQVLINGFLTKKICHELGVRKGDPLSVICFLFVSAFQTSPNIKGITVVSPDVTSSRAPATLMTWQWRYWPVLPSNKVLVFSIPLRKRAPWSGKNTRLCCTRLPPTNQLPSNAWTDENIRLLGVVIDKSLSDGREWNQVLSNFENTTKHLFSVNIFWLKPNFYLWSHTQATQTPIPFDGDVKSTKP